MISLNCWIYGDDINDAFGVQLEESDTVDSLKHKIRSIRTVGEKLQLFRVSIPCGVTIPDATVLEEAWNAYRIGKPLRALIRLDQYFTFPLPSEHIHIIIEHPIPLRLLCIMRTSSAGSEDIFEIKIKSDQSIGDLKATIHTQLALYHVVDNYLPPTQLVLWRVSFPIDDELQNRLRSFDHEEEKERLIKPGTQVSVFFLFLEETHLHVVVEVPDSGKPATHDIRGIDERRDSVTALKNRYGKTVSGILQAKPPSDAAKSSEYLKSQNAYRIYDGRYGKKQEKANTAPPIQLFHPAFVEFLHLLTQDTNVPAEIARSTVSYMITASMVHDKEDERQKALRPHLLEILGFNIVSVTNDDKTRPDGVTELYTALGPYLLMLQEDKNEFGDAGSDPSTQAGLSMARHWAQPKLSGVREVTCCPTFLLASAGPWIAILGAVFIDGVIVQRLTDYIWVGLDSALHDSQCSRVAKIFYALRQSLKKLNGYYEKLKPDGLEGLRNSRFFPSTTEYYHEGSIIKFKYTGYLENDISCVTLRAETDTKPPQDIVVKFVDRYGEKAHRILAEVGLAPKLLYCKRLQPTYNQPPSHARLFMVVMEYVDGGTLANLKHDVNKKQVKKEVSRALELLHEKGLVFGDLRTPNVMITKTNEVKLIDFNWAGVHGQAQYPYIVNSHIPWPKGVQGLANIEMAHDNDMLERLFQ